MQIKNSIITRNKLSKYSKLSNLSSDKQRISVYDQLFKYYNLQIPMSISIHKIFILIEIQVNAATVRSKLLPYIFIVVDLCRLGVIHVNGKIVANPFQITALWDVISIPTPLYNRIHYRLIRQHYYPDDYSYFFKKYWKHFTNFNYNKMWMLSNTLTSSVTAESIVFDYPNLLLYTGIFRRYTRLHYEPRVYPTIAEHRNLNHLNSLLKLKTLSYLTFYHR